MVDMPYFMENEKWYYYDYDEGKYKLTEEAPQKAQESYIEFYKEIYGGTNHAYRQKRRSD